MHIQRITIIGLGLIGGSMGRALVKAGYEVTAVDRDRHVLEKGLELNAATKVTNDLTAAVSEAQVVVLAVPVGSMGTVMRNIASSLPPEAIVTDVGSVKTCTMELAHSFLQPGQDFVGGHPMAGTEVPGIESADPRLFADALYVLTPGVNCSQRAVEVITQLVRELGACPVIMDSVKHDRAAAMLSHLPHLLAVSLAQAAANLEEYQPGSINLAAGSFRDATRVAESSPVMWQDIFTANRELLLESLQIFHSYLDTLTEAVKQENSTVITKAFAEARYLRQRSRNAHFDGQVAEVTVDIADEPGALGRVASLLGEANINIAQIKILPRGEDGSGGVVLGFESPAAASQAREVISFVAGATMR